jgi:hypothetical protein
MMKTIAILLVFGSFLAGSFLAVLDPREINWSWLAPVLLIGAVGLWLSRKAHHEEAHAGSKLAGNIDLLGKCLDKILAKLELLCKNKEELPTYEARFEIDRLFRDDLNNFAEARESMIHVFGMQNYADVMSNFAAGERYINRVWSASTDGYVDEVNLYLERALNQFREAHTHFHGLKAEHSEELVVHQGT